MHTTTLRPELQELLSELRRLRHFQPEPYLDAKATLLNEYLRRTGLSACVVAVSGGVDSAVTLGIVQRASAQRGSPIRRVVAALAPIFAKESASNQEVALARGREVATHFGVETFVLDLSEGFSRVRDSVDQGASLKGQPWATGQLVSYLRTPALYYLVSLLVQEGFPALLCGTTNRDEGSYIGFFGKASDGMVDLQLISDLHKSEVYAVAAALQLPKSVLRAVPTGDTFDGRVDEEMIGAPYDFVELFTQYLCCTKERQEALLQGLPKEILASFWELAARLQSLHQKNLHKYLSGPQAIHLDVYERAVPGGWKEEEKRAPYPIHRDRFVGEFTPSLPLLSKAPSVAPSLKKLAGYSGSAFFIEGVLRPEECALWCNELERQVKLPVGRDGRRASFDPAIGPIGSYRASIYSEDLASLLWERIAPLLPSVRVMEDFTPTDWNGHRVWRAVGLNPLLRLIWYEPGGELIPHYDAGYDFGDGRHTLMSALFYLTGNESGATRFLLDPERHLPLSERDFQDWKRPAKDRDVLEKFLPQEGAALLFDHRLLHDAEVFQGPGVKLVLRSDIIFARCGAGILEKIPGVGSERPPTKKAEDRFVAKIQRDPFYLSAYGILGSQEAVERAGFFDDKALPTFIEPRAAPEWLTTPVDKIVARLRTPGAPEGRLVVLVTTGAFCPVHPGHLEMMEAAKRALEKEGARVLGGYLSPSHDEYVAPKCAPESQHAAKRVRLCQEATKESDWLMVDPWEALHTDRAINFTDVICRLERYLSTHLRTPQPIEVVYVFGGDNARFSLSFVGRGACVCVNRPGYEARLSEYQKDPLVKQNAKIVFVQQATQALSSREVRAKERALPEKIEALWNASHQRKRLFLREEGSWAVERWQRGQEAYQRFLLGLRQLVAGLFSEVVVLGLQAQRESLQKVARERLLSLDVCILGDENVALSRCFPLGDSTRSRLTARPGAPSLPEQIAQIPPGDYVLIEDDSVSGATLQMLKELLPKDRRLIQEVTLCDLKQSVGAELMDCRDFLVGSREGGLVIELPDGSLVRAPYLLPYVSPSARCSIPYEEEASFSRELWKLNKAFFEEVAPAITVAEAFFATRDLLLYVGFAPETLMAEVCQWHIEKLSASGAE